MRRCERLGCDSSLDGLRADARYCTPTCKREAQRARALSADGTAAPGFWDRYVRVRRAKRGTTRVAPVLALTALLLMLAGCGSATRTVTVRQVRQVAPAAASACPLAATGHGAPGVCAPRLLGLGQPHAGVSGPSFLDLSNNDPCDCGAEIKAQGHVGLIVKAIQGTQYVDQTAAQMISSARSAGLAVGLYDFDQDYSLAEAHLFVARARAMGILPGTANTFPLYFDVEYGSFSYRGLLAQISYVRSQGYRVGIYTGGWYWSPHAGCQWPARTTAWLSGYPVAVAPCGLPKALFNSHQFTSSPVDQSVFLGPGAFTAFVHATPAKPTIRSKAFRIYPLRRFTIHLQRVSERRTVVTWWAHGCENPVRRETCRSTRTHLAWEAGRIVALARQRQARCVNVATCGSIWSDAPFHQAQRHWRIERILASGKDHR